MLKYLYSSIYNGYNKTFIVNINVWILVKYQYI